jgi:signal transduction histidine kinase
MNSPGPSSLAQTAGRLLLALALIFMSNAGAGAATRHVVLLFDERVELPGLAALEAEFASTLRASSTDPIEIYRESMDLSRFGSATYLPFLREILKQKYTGKKIDVVVGIMAPALDFLLASGEDIFPGASIVFCGVDKRQLGERALPANVRGILLKRDFAPTVELALQLHPTANQVMVVAGSSQFDTDLRTDAREQFRAFEQRATFFEPAGLPLVELLDEIEKLRSNTIVMFVSYFRDAAGNAYVPHEVVGRISQRSQVPVYGFVDQFLGEGIVGGKLYSVATHGREAASLTVKILNGSLAGLKAITETASQVVAFDWRQLQRWGIAEGDLPIGAEIRYRDPSFWYAYRLQIALVMLAMLLQSALIWGLIYERIQRSKAERLAKQRMADLAHANRFSTAGELTATIAHELNQPLGAILSNAESAALLLDDPAADKHELKEIIDDISRDDRRAADIIGRARSLLKKAPVEFKAADLNDVTRETINFVSAIASARKIDLMTSLAPFPLPISGDAIHLQQVIMNLFLNAADAIAGTNTAPARIVVKTERDGAFAVFSMSDNGPGIPPDRIESVFEPFFSTKSTGMGLGLSIARSIIEAHSGQILAANRPDGGAVFQIRLPVATAKVRS